MNISNWKADILLVGVYIITAILENSLALSSKAENMLTPRCVYHGETPVHSLYRSTIYLHNSPKGTLFNGRKKNPSHIHQ